MSLKKIRVACVQISAGEEVEANLERCRQGIVQARDRGARLICLPELFHYRGATRNYRRVAVRRTGCLIGGFRALARSLKVAILLGSVIERSGRPAFYYNTSVLISPAGKIVGYYRKLHLFDIRLRRGPVVSESETFLPGRGVVTANVCGLRAGLSICYDLRFPEQFRAMTFSGARVIFCPANFTDVTGKAHWEVLLRARAVENQVFIIAPAQFGADPSSRIVSHGRSLIIDPWGRILAQAGRTRPAVIAADLDLGEQARLRREFPVLTGPPRI
ncbi:MAG: carbon-nitrogen hydrolase family protein [Candidatus Omnitrophica bacterium]|nr:carbon-nitrogen hydrolase family protein [Candidatus Omnitrophota bacterium]